jgi:peptide/nickel transport system permease protein
MREKTFLESFKRHRLGVIGFIGVAIILIAGIAGPIFVPFQKGYGEAMPLAPPTGENILGTDALGLDLFAEVIWGARTSIMISASAVLVAVLIGLPLGLVSGYFRGKIGALIDSIIEITMTIPTLPLMILISALVGPSVRTVAIVIGIFAWPTLARIVRNSSLKVSQMQYIEAAKILGISNGAIMFKHILLNIAGPVLVDVTLIMATAVLTESSLSYLGLGDPNVWSWGGILQTAFKSGHHFRAWWLVIFPAASIMLYVIFFNLLGIGINETLNPKSRR